MKKVTGKVNVKLHANTVAQPIILHMTAIISQPLNHVSTVVKKVTGNLIALAHANFVASLIILPTTAHKSQLENVSIANKKVIWLTTVPTLQRKEHKFVAIAMRKVTWVMNVQSQDHAKYVVQKNIFWPTAQIKSASIAVKWVMEVALVLNQRR